MLAQTNATLTAVHAPSGPAGTRDDWDSDGENAPEVPGAVRWTGSAPAYYRETTVRSSGSAGADVTFARTVILETDTARETGVRAGDVVVVTDLAGVEHTANVAIVAVADLAGLPSAVRTTRLELESS